MILKFFFRSAHFFFWRNCRAYFIANIILLGLKSFISWSGGSLKAKISWLPRPRLTQNCHGSVCRLRIQMAVWVLVTVSFWFTLLLVQQSRPLSNPVLYQRLHPALSRRSLLIGSWTNNSLIYRLVPFSFCVVVVSITKQRNFTMSPGDHD